MAEEKKSRVHQVLHIAIILWIGFMLLQCGGCGEPDEKPEPTETPESVAAVAEDYDVSRERAEVRAHLEGESASLAEAELVTLLNSNWRDMLDFGLVWTNHAGRAELRADCSQVSGATVCNCEAVLLYENSNLVARSCHPEDPAGICLSGQAALNNCDICFETLSSRTCPEGTWVSITYLGASEITIVTVGEGAATVTPVTVLDYVETGPLEFRFRTREWSTSPIRLEAETVPSESGEAKLPFFLYTAPDANLKRIKAQAEELGITLPPPGKPLPIDQLPVLVHEEFGLPVVLEALAWEQPNLQLWMYDLSKTLYERGGIIFPPFTPPDWDLGLVLDFDGDQLADTRVQEAIVLGIDKEYVMADAFANEQVPGFHALINGVPVDAFTLPYDPEGAQARLMEVTFGEQLVYVLFPIEDDAVARAAKLIAGAVSEIGIKDLPMPVPLAEMDALRQEYALARQPAIVIYR